MNHIQYLHGCQLLFYHYSKIVTIVVKCRINCEHFKYKFYSTQLGSVKSSLTSSNSNIIFTCPALLQL